MKKKTAPDLSSYDKVEGLVIDCSAEEKGIFLVTTIVIKDSKGERQLLRLIISPRLITIGRSYVFVIDKEECFDRYVMAKARLMRDKIIFHKKRVIQMVRKVKAINFSRISGYVDTLRYSGSGIIAHVIGKGSLKGVSFVVHTTLRNLMVGRDFTFYSNDSTVRILRIFK